MACKSLRDAEPHIVGADDKRMMKVEGFVRRLSKRVNLSAVDEVGRSVVQPFYGPGKTGSQASFGIEWIKSSKRLDVGEEKSDHSAALDSMVSAVCGDLRGGGRFDLDGQDMLRVAVGCRAPAHRPAWLSTPRAQFGHERSLATGRASSWWTNKFSLSVLAGLPQASLGLNEII